MDYKTDANIPAPKKRRRLPLIIAIIALLLVIAISITAVLFKYFSNSGFDNGKYKNPNASIPSVNASAAESQAAQKVENPIRFDELRKVNADVCAWITLPNTNIDYPIMQSSKADDNFYINHSWEGDYTIDGAIYIQRQNSSGFTDRNTVIYGHNLRNGTMFRHLHKLREEKFFNENEYFYIYTPERILTYRIFAAYRYDNRHILNSFDFSDDAVYAEYLKMAQNPNSLIKLTREVELTTDDKIVTLSTCISDERYRYLVQGVLISEQATY